MIGTSIVTAFLPGSMMHYDLMLWSWTLTVIYHPPRWVVLLRLFTQRQQQTPIHFPTDFLGSNVSLQAPTIGHLSPIPDRNQIW